MGNFHTFKQRNRLQRHKREVRNQVEKANKVQDVWTIQYTEINKSVQR